MKSVLDNNRKIELSIVILFFIFSCNLCIAQNYLFNNAVTDYSIILPANASTTEKYAAKELQTYIRKVSNTDIKIISNSLVTPDKFIFVGWTSACNSPKYDDNDESFTYKTIGNNIYIYGGKNRGTMYGVFSFLENELGIRWYTSTCTHIPNIKQYKISPLNHSESPSIKRRLNLYYYITAHNDFAVHNKINSQWAYVNGEYGELNAYWGGHTFATLIPADKYFSHHPEYFSLYKGKRVSDAQLCLSNQNMRKELTRNLKEIIKDNPGYWCYDVSQNDNCKPCECDNCKALVQKYGGQSGLMIWFVNKVADEIKKTYPDVMIGSFAYQYTRKAPTSSIKPNDNVVIRLCDIECCMAHPLEECEQNKSFIEDLNSWKRIAKNLYLWDYTTGFMNYLLPFPNFNALAQNYKLFSRSNIIGILEEGQHESEWGEFSELKGWIISKLMWNADADVDSLVNIFINDYYGDAAKDIKAYYNLCNSQVTDNSHFTIKLECNSALYDDEFIRQATKLTNQAIAHSKNNPEISKRVKRIAAQIYYLKFRRNIASSLTDGSFKQLKTILDNDNTYLREPGYTFDMILKDTGYK